MLVVNRFIVSPDEPSTAEFTERATAALAVLAARPGYLRGDLARAYDDPARWSLITEWESVGAYRRALGAYDVKVAATPLLAQSLDEPSAYEVLARTDDQGTVGWAASDRADDVPGALRSRP